MIHGVMTCKYLGHIYFSRVVLLFENSVGNVSRFLNVLYRGDFFQNSDGL